MYLKEKVGLFCALVHSADVCRGCGPARLEQGAGNPRSPTCAAGTKYLPPPGMCVSRRLGWEGKPGLKPRYSDKRHVKCPALHNNVAFTLTDYTKHIMPECRFKFMH